MLLVETARTFALSREARAEITTACNAAFGQDFDALFSLLPPDGLHFLGRSEGKLVAHLVVTDRSLRFGKGRWLRSAYIDAVATLPDCRAKGYAGELLERAAALCGTSHDLLALSAGRENLYRRHGFATWRGPLFLENEDASGVSEVHLEELLMLRAARETTPSEELPLTANWRPGGGF
jgi:GNAT superfamily N-acetyltransferase